jgi:hypothetical protein
VPFQSSSGAALKPSGAARSPTEVELEAHRNVGGSRPRARATQAAEGRSTAAQSERTAAVGGSVHAFRMTTLMIATSPRSTWITAPDVDSAAAIRALLVGRFHEVHRRGQVDPLAIDVGIGVEAMEAGEVLIQAGHSFRWHPDQHPLNRDGTAWGISVDEG